MTIELAIYGGRVNIQWNFKSLLIIMTYNGLHSQFIIVDLDMDMYIRNH